MNYTNSTAVATRKTLRDLIEQPAYANRIKEVLRDKAPEFTASLVTTVNSSFQLSKCDPNTVMGCAIKAAALDLPIEPAMGFAYLVPFKDTCTLIIGYRGWIQLALRTGQYERMNAARVTEGAFRGYDDVGEPKIDWGEIDDAKPSVGYAFAFKLVNGFVKTVYWSHEKVMNHARQYSAAYRNDKKDSPWFTDFESMALKTVILYGLRKWGILSVQMRNMIEEQIKQDEIKEPKQATVLDLGPEKEKPDIAAQERATDDIFPPVETASEKYPVDEAKPTLAKPAQAPERLEKQVPSALAGFKRKAQVIARESEPESKEDEPPRVNSIGVTTYKLMKEVEGSGGTFEKLRAFAVIAGFEEFKKFDKWEDVPDDKAEVFLRNITKVTSELASIQV